MCQPDFTMLFLFRFLDWWTLAERDSVSQIMESAPYTRGIIAGTPPSLYCLVLISTLTNSPWDDDNLFGNGSCFACSPLHEENKTHCLQPSVGESTCSMSSDDISQEPRVCQRVLFSCPFVFFFCYLEQILVSEQSGMPFSLCLPVK